MFSLVTCKRALSETNRAGLSCSLLKLASSKRQPYAIGPCAKATDGRSSVSEKLFVQRIVIAVVVEDIAVREARGRNTCDRSLVSISGRTSLTPTSPTPATRPLHTTTVGPRPTLP